MTRAQDRLHGGYPKDYRWVRVSVKARSAPAAAEEALDALSLLLGLWNLSLNAGTSRFSVGRRRPVNPLGLAPVHSVHYLRGRPSGEEWWYEPDYVGPLQVRRLRDKAPRMVLNANKMRRRLRVIPDNGRVEEAIRAYNKALNTADWSASFVRLWQALEVATNSAEGPRKVTVRRASFIYRDHD